LLAIPLPCIVHGAHKAKAGRDGAPLATGGVSAGTAHTDCLDSQPDTGTWPHDYAPGMWLPIRKFLDTGRGNDYGCRPCPTDTQYSRRTPGDIPRKDHPGTGADNYRHRSNTGHWDRRATADRDSLRRVLQGV